MKFLNELFQEANDAGSWEEWMIRVRRSNSGSTNNVPVFINEESGGEEEYTEGAFSEQNES